jgi:hypothetical protein
MMMCDFFETVLNKDRGTSTMIKLVVYPIQTESNVPTSLAQNANVNTWSPKQPSSKPTWPMKTSPLSNTMIIALP